MISERYDIEEFLTAMIGKDWYEIIPAGNGECATAEARSYSVRGAPKARKLGSTKYASAVKKFLYFMNYGTLPDHLSDRELRLYRLITDSLVEKKQLIPAVLDQFK
jgi:hypothetical protein